MDILRQVLIGNGADLLGALHLAGGQGKGLAGFQHLDAVLELLQADLRAFGVQQGGDGLAQLLAQSLQLGQTAAVLLVRAVGKVKTGHVHAVGDQVAQDVALVGGRAKGADDFRFSHFSTSNFLNTTLYLNAAAQTAAFGKGRDPRPFAAAKDALVALVQNHTTLYYKRLDTIGQEEDCKDLVKIS